MFGLSSPADNSPAEPRPSISDSDTFDDALANLPSILDRSDGREMEPNGFTSVPHPDDNWETSSHDASNQGSPTGTGTPATAASIIFDENEETTGPVRTARLETAPVVKAVRKVPVNSRMNPNEPYILVIGGLGYIGSHTTIELARAGFNVAIVDNLSNAQQSVLKAVRDLARRYNPMSDLPFFEVDYTNKAAMEAVLDRFQTEDNTSLIGGVIHFAAYKSVEESISKPIGYYQNNVCGLVQLVDILGSYGIFNLVFSSSATVYGAVANQGRRLREHNMVHSPTLIKVGPDDAHSNLGAKRHATPQGGDKIVEIEPGSLGITSPYGRTKYMCEAILSDVAKADPRWNVTLLRYFNPVGCHPSGLIGEHPRQTPTNLVPVIIQVLVGERKLFQVFGTDYDTPDGTAVRDFIHVQDLARGHIAALKSAQAIIKGEKRRTGKGEVHQAVKVYNLGTGTGHTVKEVIAAIEKASGRSIPTEFTGRRAGDVGSCVAAADLAENELDWRATRTLEDCARDVWNYTVKSRGLDAKVNEVVGFGAKQKPRMQDDSYRDGLGPKPSAHSDVVIISTIH